MSLLDLLKPKWKRSDPRVRLEAVDALDQPALRTLALHDESENVRLGATERLADETTLAKIAEDDTDSRVRTAAIKRIENSALLSGLALSEPEPDVQLVAIRGIKDQSRLAELILTVSAKKSGRRHLIEPAISGLSDQGALTRVVLESPDERTQRLASERITDQASLVEIVFSRAHHGCRSDAARRITNEDALVRIARTVDSDHIAGVATERVADERALLALVAHRGVSVTTAALPLIEDFEALSRLVLELDYESRKRCITAIVGVLDARRLKQAAEAARDERVKGLIAQELLEQEELSAQVRDAGPEYSRSDIREIIEATKKLKDQELLCSIATTAPVSGLRGTAADRVRDQRTLTIIALTDDCQPIRERTVSRLEDDWLRSEIQAYGARVTDPSLVKALTNSSTDASAWETIASTSHDSLARRLATQKVVDKVTLVKVAYGDQEPATRSLAAKRIGSDPSLAGFERTDAVLRLAQQKDRGAFEESRETLRAATAPLEAIHDANRACAIRLIDSGGVELAEKETLILFLLEQDCSRCLDASLTWLLNTFHGLSAPVLDAVRSRFGDYAALLVDLRTYERKEQSSFVGRGGSGSHYHSKYSYDESKMDRATEELCRRQTVAAFAVLEKLAERKSISVTMTAQCDVEFKSTLDFKSHKTIAQEELQRRGDPRPDLAALADPESWKYP